MRKILSALLVLTMILSLVPAFAVQTSAAREGIWQYEVSDGEATITGVNIPVSGHIDIPSTLGGYQVTAIGSSAFECCSSLISINIPSSVTWIGIMAFYGCTGLTSINIPLGVTFIGYRSFEACTGLTSIAISESVTDIDMTAFSGCSGLTSITVNKNNPVYASSGNCLIDKETKTLILGCKTSIIPSDGSVTSINTFAFDGCTGLTNITIPKYITYIDSMAFYGCTGVAGITVDKNNPVYTSAGNCLIEKDTKTIIIGCKTSVIPQDGSVTEIGYMAFYYCSGLEKIDIPASVTNISSGAFLACTDLISITVDKNNPAYTSVDNCLIEKKTKTLVLGCKTSVIPQDGSVTKIGDYAFSHCIGLTSMTITEGVTEIGEFAFADCYNLTNIIIPSSVTSIGGWAFSDCTGLTSVIIPASVVYIDHSSFNFCDNLTIYGVKGSYAETYADKNGIPFVEYRELTDTSSGVTVGGGVPENAELSVVVKEQTAEKALFDISLVKDGETVQPNGTVRVALPVPQGMNGADMRVYRISDNGAKTDMNAVYSNGFMIFETDHFSLYSIEPTLNIVYGDADGNGEVDITDAMLVFYHVAKKELLPAEALVRCNVNDDNEVDIADAMAIFYFVAKKTDSVRP